jgi:hypothetical protein
MHRTSLGKSFSEALEISLMTGRIRLRRWVLPFDARVTYDGYWPED